MSSTIEITRQPWKLGRLVSPKPPFKPKHIWAIRTRLQHESRTPNFALFKTAIDSKLRGCDLVCLRATDVHRGDSVRLRSTIIQQKMGRPVAFELTETTRKTLTVWLKLRACGLATGCSRAATPRASI